MMNFNSSRILKSVKKSVICASFQLSVLLAILFCFASLGNAQELLYDAAGKNTSFVKIGGTQNYILNWNTNTVLDGKITIKSGSQAVKVGGINRSVNDGVTVIVLLSDINVTGGGQLTELPINETNNSNAAGFKIKAETTDGTVFPTADGNQWGSADGTIKVPTDGRITAIAQVYRYDNGSLFYVDGVRSFSSAGLRWASQTINHLRIGGKSLLNSDFLNVGMKIHRVQIYAGALTEAQIVEKTTKIKEPLSFDDLTLTVKTNQGGTVAFDGESSTTVTKPWGTLLTAIATAPSGMKFSKWIDATTKETLSTSHIYGFNAIKNITLVACFDIPLISVDAVTPVANDGKWYYVKSQRSEGAGRFWTLQSTNKVIPKDFKGTDDQKFALIPAGNASNVTFKAFNEKTVSFVGDKLAFNATTPLANGYSMTLNTVDGVKGYLFPGEGAGVHQGAAGINNWEIMCYYNAGDNCTFFFYEAMNNASLKGAINTALDKLNCASIGKERGNYPKSAWDAYSTAISEAMTYIDSTDVNLINSAIKNLANATTLFDDSCHNKIYVSLVGNDANDGVTWGSAKLTIQAAINAAKTTEEVWVEAGEYLEGNNDGDKGVLLKERVSLLGGFMKNATSSNPLNRTKSTIKRKDPAPGYRIMTGQGGTNYTNTYVDGFILDGEAKSCVAAGGALGVWSPGLTIRNCEIINARTTTTGGGVQVNANLTMINTVISGNQSTDGSDGLHGGGIHVGAGILTLDNCSILGNRSFSRGGGLGLSGGSAMVSNTKIMGNCANFNGAGGQTTANATFDNCIIANNFLTGNGTNNDNDKWGGGGFNIAGGTVTFNHCTIVKNHCGSKEGGGGICQAGGTVNIKNSILWGNIAGPGASQFVGEVTRTTCAIEGDATATVNLNANNIDPSGPNFLIPTSGGADASANSADWRLLNGSICLAKGTASVCEKDILGAVRGNPPSLGAYELSSASVETPLEPTDNCYYFSATGAGLMNGSSWLNAAHGSRFSIVNFTEEKTIKLAKGDYYLNARKENMKIKIEGGYDVTGERPQIEGGRPWEYVNVSTIYGPASGDAQFFTIPNGYNLANQMSGVTLTSRQQRSGDGGIVATETGTINATHCVFKNGKATGNGGAVYVSGVGALKLNGCYFLNNQTSVSTSGAAVDMSGGVGRFENCHFYLNYGTHASNAYGAVGLKGSTSADFMGCSFIKNRGGNHGGGVIGHYGTSGTVCVINTLVANNGSDGTYGGSALRAENANVILKVINSTVVYTKCGGGSGRGHGISFSSNVNNELINTVVWGNAETSGGAQVNGTFTAKNSAVQGLTKEGVINLDPTNITITGPNFKNTSGTAGYSGYSPVANWDFNHSLSPLFEAGTETNAPSTDIQGKARPSYPNGLYDIGAYEYQYPEIGEITRTSLEEVEGVGVFEFDVKLLSPFESVTPIELSLEYENARFLTNPPARAVIPTGSNSVHVSIPMVPNTTGTDVTVTAKPVTLPRQCYADPAMTPASVIVKKSTVEPINYTIILDKPKYTEGDKVTITMTRDDSHNALIEKTITIELTGGGAAYLAPTPVQLSFHLNDTRVTKTFLIKDLVEYQWGGTTGKTITFSSPTTDPFIETITSSNATIADKSDDNRRIGLVFQPTENAIPAGGMVHYGLYLRAGNFPDTINLGIGMTDQAADFTIEPSTVSFAPGEGVKALTVTSKVGSTYSADSYGINVVSGKPDWMDLVDENTAHFIVGETIYVTPEGAGNQLGANWANAAVGKGTGMQTLLDIVGMVGMKEVRLGPGEYSIRKGITLADDVSLIGGWNTTTNERDSTQRPTIKTINITGAQNAAFKPTATSEATRNVFDGLIMQWASGIAPVIYSNGPVFVSMKQVDFIGYQSTDAAPINLEGTGFNVIAEDCKFINTDGNWMGTVHIYTPHLTNFLKFERCVIDGNTTKLEGLICLRANITMNNCIIRNSKGEGNIFSGTLDGSMAFKNNFTNCTFIDNLNRPLFGSGNPSINVMKNSLVMGSPVDLAKVTMTHSAWESAQAIGTNIDITGKTKAVLIDDNLVPLSTSILVNAGSNTDIASDAKDFAGKNRIWNPSTRTDGVVDIGVCESQVAGTCLVNFVIPGSVIYTGNKLDVVKATYADQRAPQNDLNVIYTQDGIVVDPMNAGTYDVSASDPSGHWNITNQTSFSIEKAAQLISGIPLSYSLKKEQVYTFEPTITSKTPILMNAPDSNYTGVEPYTVKYDKEGSYKITFSAGETDNYFAANDVTCDLNVSENSVVVTKKPVIELKVDNGDPMPKILGGEAQLNGEGPVLEGEWSWNNNDPITLGKESRSVIFTPAEPTYVPVSVSYVFEIKTYTLTVNGAVKNLTKDKYVKGDLLTITPIASAGNAFDYWTAVGFEISSDKEFITPLSFEMPANNVTVTANFSDASIHYITLEGSGRKDGASWKNAGDKSNIGTFLAKGSVNEVRLAEGNYPLTAPIAIPANKILSGGWDSTDGVQKYKTLKSILQQGTIGQRVLTLSSSSVLDGISITGVSGANAIYSNGGNAIIRKCRIYGNNRAETNLSTVVLDATSNTIEDCLIYDNISQDGIVGFKQSDGIVRRCVFVNNNTNFGDGGAVRFWGGAANSLLENCLIANNNVYGDTSGGGSALFSQVANITVRNCTVTNNQLNKKAFAIYDNASSFKMQNVIVCNSGGATNQAPGSLVNSAWNGITGIGNINISNIPSDYFIAPNTQSGYVAGKGEELLANDWSLLASSQLINTGSNTNITSTKDLAGNSRIWNPEGSTLGIIDMGAYEYQGARECHVIFSNYDPVAPNGDIQDQVKVADLVSSRSPAPNWVVKYYVGDEETEPRAVNNYTVKAIDTNGHWFSSDTVIFIITDKSSYNVTIDGGAGKAYFEGTPVIGTVTPSEGKFIEKLTYTGVEALSETMGGKYNFIMPGNAVSITSISASITSTRYVTVNGNGDKSGYNWNTAMSNEVFQSFDFATSTATKVCMAAGDYKFTNKYVVPANKTIEGGYFKNTTSDEWERPRVATSAHGDGTIIYPWEFGHKTNITGGPIELFSVAGKLDGVCLSRTGSPNLPVVTLSSGGIMVASIVQNSSNTTPFDGAPAVGNLLIQGGAIAEGCFIYNNNNGNQFAGGIAMIGASSLEKATLKNSIIAKNTAAHCGGGIYIKGVTAVIENCLVANNTATSWEGGGIYHHAEGALNIKNCALIGNYAGGDPARGGGLDCANLGTHSITNTIFYLNKNTSGGNVATNNIGRRGTMTLSYTATAGVLEAGTGNINIANNNTDSMAPLFINPATVDGAANFNMNHDYRLNVKSKLVNAGKNSDQMGSSKDLAGKIRVWNPAGQGGGVVDMGAYELQVAGEKEATISQGVVIYNGKVQKQLTAQTIDLRQPITKDFNFTFNPVDVINAGTYNVAIKDALGHWIYTPNGTYTISKANQNLIVTPSRSVVKLKESLQFGIVDGESGHPVSIGCTPATYIESSGLYTFSATGDYTFTFTQLGNVNYNDATDTMVIKVVENDASIAPLTAGDLKTETYTKKTIVANNGTTNSTSPIIYQYRKQGASIWEESAVLAGTYDVKLSVADDGTYLANEIIATGNLVISPKALTVSGLRITTRPYDWTITAFVSYWGDLVGVISGDDVKYIHQNGTAAYYNADVGDAKKVIVSGLTIEGLDIGNYAFTGRVNALGDIANKATSKLYVEPLTINNATEAIQHAGQVKLGWDAVTNVTDFMIEYGIGGSFENTRLVQGTSAIVSELLSEAPYSFRLSYNEPSIGSVLSNTVEASAPYYVKVNENYFPAMAWEPNELAITSFATPYSQGTGVIDAEEFVEGRDHKNNEKVWMRDFTHRTQPFVVFGGLSNTLNFSVPGENSKLHVWIDLNHNGTFDDNEYFASIPENGIVSLNITPSTHYGSYMMMRARVAQKDVTVDAFGFNNTNAGMAWDAKLFIQSSGEVLFTVTLTAGVNGQFVDASGATITSVSVQKGSDVDVRIKPNEKYSIESVSMNGKPASIKPMFTLKNIQGPQTVSAQFTDFPTVYIDVNDGSFITSKEEYKKATVIMEQNSLTPDGDVIVKKVDNIEIKGRGNSTWSMEKKPYRLKFGKATQQSYLGLGVARNWVLLANYIDPTGLKNDVAFEMGRRLNVPFTKNTRPVRLILNGRYDGLYQLTGHNEVRDNTNAVDINEKDWYSEFDTYPDEFIYTTPKYKLPMKFKQPEYVIGGSLDPIIKAQIDTFETGLSENKTGEKMGRPDLGYENSINEESFIDWILVHMIAGNYEPKHPKSSYYHTNTKTGNGKITAGNLWDFDWAYGYGTNEGDFYTLKNCMWYKDLFQYPKFTMKFKKRWEEIRPMLESESESIYNYIDTKGAFIEKEQNKDYARWNKKNTYLTEKEGLKIWIKKNIEQIQSEVDKMNLSSYTKGISAGTVSPNLTVTFPSTGVWGDSIRITISPNVGYSIGEVQFNTTTITPINGVYEFMMPNEAVKINASSVTRQVATIVVVGGTASLKSAYEGDVITVTATPPSDNNFNNWSASPSVTFSAPFELISTFVAPAGTTTVTANCVAEDYVRYIATSSTGSGKGLNWANAASVDSMTTFLSDDNVKTLLLGAGNYSIKSTLSIPSSKKCIGGWETVLNTPAATGYSTLIPLPTLNQVATLATGTQSDSTLFENMIVQGIAGKNGVSTSGYSVIKNCQFINNNYKDHLLLIEGTEGVHIDKCIITNNIGVDACGALFIKGSVLMTESTIENNTKGSGIYAYYSTFEAPLTYHFILQNSKINTNTSSTGGGGIYIELTPNNGHKLTMTQYLIENCQLRGNTAQKGGAIYIMPNNVSNLEFTDSSIVKSCHFSENVATSNGGAIYILNQIGTLYQVKNCIFYKNSATLGGAIYTSSNMDMEYSTLVNNTNDAINIDNTVSIPTVNLINTVLYQNFGLGVTQYTNCAVGGTIENAGKMIEGSIYENSFYLHPENDHALGPRFKHKTQAEAPKTIDECDTEFILAPRSILINRGKQ